MTQSTPTQCQPHSYDNKGLVSIACQDSARRYICIKDILTPVSCIHILELKVWEKPSNQWYYFIWYIGTPCSADEQCRFLKTCFIRMEGETRDLIKCSTKNSDRNTKFERGWGCTALGGLWVNEVCK